MPLRVPGFSAPSPNIKISERSIGICLPRYVTGEEPMVLRTVGVRATGEKTAREPDRSLTVWPVREMEEKEEEG